MKNAGKPNTYQFMKKNIVILMLVGCVGVLYRFLTIYPSSLFTETIDPVFIALQAFDILNGELPIFFPGQDYMGSIGVYFIAILYKILGVTTFTLSFSAWFWISIWYILMIIMTFIYFGFSTALIFSISWLIPTKLLVYWGTQARPDYQICFVLIPLIFILTYRIILKHLNGNKISWSIFFLGLCCGLGFWTNIAIGPAVVISFLFLIFQFKKSFFKLILFRYTLGWLIGYFPVLYFKITNPSSLSLSWNPVSLKNLHNLPTTLKAFFLNALPSFLGLSLSDKTPLIEKTFTAFFVIYLILAALLMIYKLLIIDKQSKKSIPFAITISYLFLHVGLLSITDFGARFHHPHNLGCTGYLTPIYGFILVLCAVFITSFKNRFLRILLALPLIFYIYNNYKETKKYPKNFYKTFKNKYFADISSFPVPEDNFLKFCKTHDLKRGYIGKYLDQPLNLSYLGKISLTNFYKERRILSALKSDATKNLFWISHNNNLQENFKMLNLNFKEKNILGRTLFYDFKQEMLNERLIDDVIISASKNTEELFFLFDRVINTDWTLSPDKIENDHVTFKFNKKINLSKIVIIPTNHASIPKQFSIQACNDGKSWKTILNVTNGESFFWSVYHPFWKVVKPRMEVVIPANKEFNFFRILINGKNQKRLISIREIYLYSKKASTKDAKDYNNDLNNLCQRILKKYKGFQIIADHWFESYFKILKFDVEFISNQCQVTGYGRNNPHWKNIIPINFHKSLIIISSKSNSFKIDSTLKNNNIFFTHEKFNFHDLFIINKEKTSHNLYWNGIDINDILTA